MKYLLELLKTFRSLKLLIKIKHNTTLHHGRLATPLCGIIRNEILISNNKGILFSEEIIRTISKKSHKHFKTW